MNGTVTQARAPMGLAYDLIIKHKEDLYLVEALEGITLTRGLDMVPAKLTCKVISDDVLVCNEGDLLIFKVNGEVVFQGYIFEKSMDSTKVLSIMAYDQLRYFKNKDYYVYGGITATDLLKMICTDYQLTTGELDNTQYVIPSVPMRIEKNKTLADIVQYALDQTLIHTPNHDYYHVYDDGGKIMLKALKAMETDVYIDSDVMEDIEYRTSIDKDTFNVVRVVRQVPNGESQALVNTAILQDDEHIKEWGKLQYLLLPDDKEVNAVDKAKRIMSLKNRKTRDIRLKSVLGDIRIRGGSLVYVKRELGDMTIDNYVMVSSVTHHFHNGIHLMDLDLYYQGEPAPYTVTKDEDKEAVKAIEEAKQAQQQTQGLNTQVSTATGGTSGQVDTAFAANEGRVSQYGSVGCVETVVNVGSNYNKDLKDLADQGTANVDDMVNKLQARGYRVESYTGYANKGDILVYGNNDHVIIADGAGGGFGNSSSRGYAMRYGDVNYAWRNGEAPTKVIRMV